MIDFHSLSQRRFLSCLTAVALILGLPGLSAAAPDETPAAKAKPAIAKPAVKQMAKPDPKAKPAAKPADKKPEVKKPNPRPPRSLLPNRT